MGGIKTIIVVAEENILYKSTKSVELETTAPTGRNLIKKNQLSYRYLIGARFPAQKSLPGRKIEKKHHRIVAKPVKKMSNILLLLIISILCIPTSIYGICKNVSPDRDGNKRKKLSNGA